MVSRVQLRELKRTLSASETHGKWTKPNSQTLLETINEKLIYLQRLVQKEKQDKLISSNLSQEDILEALWIISDFFRNEKFESTVLPVLGWLQKKDDLLWKKGRIGETNMPLSAKSFENMKKSTPDSQNEWWEPIAWQKERELELLKIYGVTLEDIGRLIRSTSLRARSIITSL